MPDNSLIRMPRPSELPAVCSAQAFTRNLLKPRPQDRWLLITSAYHMPRAVGVFRHAGLDVIPFPVDFRTRDVRDVWRPFDRIGEGLERADIATKEWIGLIAYYLAERSADLFPGPTLR